MIKLGKAKSNFIELIGVFDGANIPKEVEKKANEITIFPKEKIAYIYLGKSDNFCLEELKVAVQAIIAKNKKGFNLNLSDFSTKNVEEKAAMKMLVEEYSFLTLEVWNKKTGKNAPKPAKDIIITGVTKAGIKDQFKESLVLTEAQAFARNLQTMAPNECTSVTLAEMVRKEFKSSKNVATTVLNLPEIKKLKMGLLQAVNMGSNDDARVVILEYKGNPSSKEKTVMVGKGITFDAGGMNIKTGRHMNGMKYDMSGAAIVIGAMKAISQLKPKANVSIVAPLTDNKISKTAGLPDSVWTSMNGKTVEINNTDAEGRLVLADGITYAIRKLNATRIIDVATLTGAVLAALGHTYTGVWTTKDSDWLEFDKIAKEQNELVWRMPFHKDFSNYIKKSEVADLKNTDFTGLGGSSSAAMFLKEFVEDVPYIHCDIAGSSEKNEKCLGPLVKTLAKLFR